MTEENPQPEQAPQSPDENTPEDVTKPVDGSDVDHQPGADPSYGDAPSAPPAPDAEAPQPPVPPASPTPWPPVDTGSLPSPEDDAALREERAKRFGAGPQETPPAAQVGEGAGSGDPGSHSPQTPAAPGYEAGPQYSQEPPTQAFTTGHDAPPAAPAGPAPVVTPLPAAPAASTGETPFPPTTQMPAGAPMQPGPVHDDFEGFDEGPVSRAAAHWWTILITLIFAPVAWYLFTDGGLRIALAFQADQAPAVSHYIEFGFGLLAAFIYLLAARWSSLGSIIMGSLFFAAGLAFLVFHESAWPLLRDFGTILGRLGQFGVNVTEHLGDTLATGRMALYGLVMIMVGVVSHGARRQGRREERTKIALGE